MAWQFIWDLLLVGIVVLLATRVGVILDREHRLSVSAKWALLIGLVLACALFLSLLRLAEPR
jgi:hypothetical protein